MKRTIWSGLAALVFAAVVAIPVIAQPPQPGGGRGPGWGGPGRMGPMPMLRGLDLTDAQREQIRALTEPRRAQADNPAQKAGDLERQLQEALFADVIDQSKIDGLKNAVAAAMAEELTARVELQTRIAEILTPEQRAQAREALGKRGTRGPGGPDGRRGRGKV